MRNKSSNPLFLALSLLLITAMPSSAFADTGQFYIAPGIHWMNWHNETMLSNDINVGLGFGYDFTDRLSGEISGLWFDPERVGVGVEDDYDIWRVNLLYGLGDLNSRVSPFVVTGLGQARMRLAS